MCSHFTQFMPIHIRLLFQSEIFFCLLFLTWTLVYKKKYSNAINTKQSWLLGCKTLKYDMILYYAVIGRRKKKSHVDPLWQQEKVLGIHNPCLRMLKVLAHGILLKSSILWGVNIKHVAKSLRMYTNNHSKALQSLCPARNISANTFCMLNGVKCFNIHHSGTIKGKLQLITN